MGKKSESLLQITSKAWCFWVFLRILGDFFEEGMERGVEKWKNMRYQLFSANIFISLSNIFHNASTPSISGINRLGSIS